MNEEQMHEISQEVSEEEELSDVIALIDEEGQTQLFEIIGQFDFENGSYAVLADRVGDSDAAEDEVNVVVYKIVDEDGEDVLYEIEDDNEWERVVDHWNAMIDE